ncbi:small integral membrane protein 14 [Dendroctonus ponderosae]|uniref:Small integral membrane protein 14 n=1 Tax=Dendroctonus ponderosae TaxID=77166 RepID=U4UA07_DENPD|nr:small integral membrane protein 14 [Dendroctonus ponderosae]ERL90774.1 hypothetical protein D910_08120 [Dendroctonus ponderosae]KAH1003096.1 hypothetical protein HUJ05_011036 [Dendroctonus ponderosae]
MGDQPDFDPCECLTYHELAMRRLLHMLRNSQADCTDTECSEPVLMGLSTGGPPLQHIYFLIFLVGMALLLHFYRPTLDMPLEPHNKPANGHGSNQPPPAPPID